MEAKDITKAKVLAYLQEKGVSPSQIFGKESERLDPIDRHIILRDLYQDILGYTMEKEGLSRIDPDDPHVKIIHPNMKDFEGITTVEDCVTNLKFLAYGKEARLLHQKGHSREADQNKIVDLEQLKNYFQKEHGKSLDDLFKDSSYYRFTKEGGDMLLAGIEHYTGWKMGKFGLEMQDPVNPRAYLAHPKVKNMSDLKTLDAYLAKINELRKDRIMHLHLIQKGKDAADESDREDKLKKDVSEFLEKQGWDLSMLFDSKRSMSQRKEKMNAVLRKFSKTYINEEQNVVIINPIGETHQATKDGGFTFSKIENTDHFLSIVRGFKQNRDLSYYIASPFVGHGEVITHEKAQYIAQEKLGFSLPSVLLGKGMTETERNTQLDSLHFYLSEAHQDGDMDLVVSHPHDETRLVSIKEIKDKENYYTSIQTLDDFMDKVKLARNRRDMLHNALNRLHDLSKKDQDVLRDVLNIKDDNEQER
jgi:hypothetical protein